MLTARRAISVAATVVTLLLVGCEEPAPVQVGFIGGLSGRSTDIGEASRNAVQLAVEQINARGGINGREVELLVRDDADDPEAATRAVRDLHQAGVEAIIGPNISSIAAAMQPVVNELQVVAISPTASSLMLAGQDDYLFRINWTTRDNAIIYAQRYLERGVRRFAVALDANNRVFSQSWLDEFRAPYESGGGEIVAVDAFDATDARGFADTAEALLAVGPDAILFVANSVDTAQLTQQIRKQDSDTLLVAAEWAASERLLQLGGRAIEGMELVQSYNRSDESARYVAFRDAYRSRFAADPGYSSLAAHDAATMLFTALAQDDETVPLKQRLIQIGAVQGLQQMVRFDVNGDAQRSAFFVVIRDGTFAPQ